MGEKTSKQTHNNFLQQQNIVPLFAHDDDAISELFFTQKKPAYSRCEGKIVWEKSVTVKLCQREEFAEYSAQIHKTKLPEAQLFLFQRC